MYIYIYIYSYIYIFIYIHIYIYVYIPYIYTYIYIYIYTHIYIAFHELTGTIPLEQVLHGRMFEKFVGLGHEKREQLFALHLASLH